MQAHLTLIWANVTLWNADVSGRPSFPDPDATRDWVQTLGKVSEAGRPVARLILSLTLWVSHLATHFSAAHFFPYKLGVREIPILEGHY